jgi:hypothetical protein
VPGASSIQARIVFAGAAMWDRVNDYAIRNLSKGWVFSNKTNVRTSIATYPNFISWQPHVARQVRSIALQRTRPKSAPACYSASASPSLVRLLQGFLRGANSIEVDMQGLAHILNQVWLDALVSFVVLT